MPELKIGKWFVPVAVLWAFFHFLNLAAAWFLILFFPAAMSATGFIQGFGHFCAGFGMRGLFNFGPEVGKTESVSQAEFRAQDKKKAMRIFAYSILIGLAIAAIGYVAR